MHYCHLKELQQEWGYELSTIISNPKFLLSRSTEKRLRLTFEPLNEHLLKPRYSAATFRQITNSKVEHTLYDLKDDITITDDVIGQNVIIRKYSLRRRSDCTLLAHFSKKFEASSADEVSRTLKTRQILY